MKLEIGETKLMVDGLLETLEDGEYLVHDVQKLTIRDGRIFDNYFCSVTRTA